MQNKLSQTSASSDYFDNDPEFIKALADVVIPEDPAEDSNTSTSHIPESFQDYSVNGHSNVVASLPLPMQPGRKRKHRSSSEEEDDVPRTLRHDVADSIDQTPSNIAYLSSDTYGASRFGDFGQYMHRKRQKLQIQNSEIEPSEGILGSQSPSSRLFYGLQIYINGWTDPSVQELRQMIIKHGGIYHAYLDKKSLVTHIITCSLTPAKLREFKHMKVATPDWLVRSIEAGVLLPWSDFKYEQNVSTDMSQGRKIAQTSLVSGGFLTQPPSHTSVPTQVSAKQQAAPTKVSPVETSSGRVNLLGSDAASTTSPRKSQHAPAPATPSLPINVPATSITTAPIRSIPLTDPSNPEEAAHVPGYAADKSNIAAQRAMADPAWRSAHTSVAPDFIEGYYRNSRLHHLSTWKAELRNLVIEAQERAESGNGVSATPPSAAREEDSAVSKIIQENIDGKIWAASATDEDFSMKGARLVKGKGKEKEKAQDDGERVIMHCDFDSFFVSAGLVDRPHLRGKPVVVCHSQGGQGGQSSTSEIASASYEARKFGIKSGMSLQQARKLCPGIVTIPYEFQRYKQFSLQFYTILMTHADDLQAVSVDEALIDVSSSVRRIKEEISLSQDQDSGNSGTSHGDPAKDFADAIRTQVKDATGCEVSIGIAHNIMLARLASRKAKPAGSFHLLPEDIPSFIDTLNIDNLHGFGYAAYQKAQEKLGTTSLRELAKKSKAVLCDALGRSMGETLYKAIRGVDDKKLESDKPRHSVSCDINYGIRFENNEQAEAFIYQLSEEVMRRLQSISMCGRSLTLKIMKRDPSAPVEAPKFMGHGLCESFTKQTTLIAPGGRATSDSKIIGDHAWKLLKSLNFDPKELRGIGIQVQKLEKADAGSAVGDQEQRVLPFKPVTSPRKERPADNDEKLDNGGTSDITDSSVHPPASKTTAAASDTIHDLPPFSQVDRSVLEALPDDLRTELETEYKRRSVTPAIPEEGDKGKKRAQSTSVFKEPFLPTKRIVVKGTSNLNVKRITRQLAPKRRGGLSPRKTTLFNKKPSVIPTAISNSVKLKISEEELRKLDIDPEVFLSLPPSLQREQLALARHTRSPVKGAISYATQRKVLKPPPRTRRLGTPGIVIPPPPPPQASFPDPPTLKQRGPNKGEKLYFTEIDDIQDVVEKWFKAFREKAPNAKDVQFFETWLVRCVDGSTSTDGGLEKGIKVMKWWQLLLRREFGVFPRSDGGEQPPKPGDPVSVGQAWWSAFNGVKAKMDAVSRAKFGGCLSLR